MLNRHEYAALIQKRLEEEAPRLHKDFGSHTVQSCYIDNLLPEELALEIVQAFPDKSTMTLKKLAGEQVRCRTNG